MLTRGLQWGTKTGYGCSRMTSDEVLRIVETYWAGIEHSPPAYPVIFEQPRLEEDPFMIDLFRDDFGGLPLRNGYWHVTGKWQLPPGMFIDPPGPTFMIDDQTGTFCKFCSL